MNDKRYLPKKPLQREEDTHTDETLLNRSFQVLGCLRPSFHDTGRYAFSGHEAAAMNLFFDIGPHWLSEGNNLANLKVSMFLLFYDMHVFSNKLSIALIREMFNKVDHDKLRTFLEYQNKAEKFEKIKQICKPEPMELPES